MNTAAIAVLVAAAVAGAACWALVDRSRGEITDRAVGLAALVPAVLLAVAGLLAWLGAEAGHGARAVGAAAAVAAAVTGGGLVATAVLKFADHAPVGLAAALRRHDDAEPATATGGAVSDPQTLRGGAWIGVLERAAVAVTLLAGWPEGLAVVLAVKGLGRFPELNRPAAAERFIVGTFASVLWAVAAAGVAVALRQ